MDQRVFLMVTITVANKREFNIFWERESLPHWLRYAKHIGSFTYDPYVGGPSNQIVRLFEYESLDKWVEWEKWLHQTAEGKDLLGRLAKFNIVAEPRLLAPAPTE